MGKFFEFGDWRLLYLLSKNMEPLVFGEFLRELYNTIKDKTEKKAEPASTSLLI